MEGRLPFITNFRVLNNIGVAVGILAVDFVVFPRRFAKTETFGTGIMDGGVGAYVLMNAIVSPEARGQYQRLVYNLTLYYQVIYSDGTSYFMKLKGKKCYSETCSRVT